MSKDDTQKALGKLVQGNPERDAIHIAVVPVTAFSDLSAGMRVGFKSDGRVGRLPDEVIGIVDPFLTETVSENDRFWLFLLPNTITSLKHVWTHPAFQDEPAFGPGFQGRVRALDASMGRRAHERRLLRRR